MKEIPLTQGKVAFVDDEDYETLMRHKWYAKKRCNTFYAWRTVNDKSISMHRTILNAQPGQLTDHRDHNGLNNRRKNLRICTSAENVRHSRKRTTKCTSRFVGVYLVKRTGSWEARVSVKRKPIYVGCFKTEEEAARARDATALLMHGDFAYLNFPEHAAVPGP